MDDMLARVFNIQRYSIYDGPGIRTLVFFQGCPLRCLWCSNPEGKLPQTRIMWSQSVCRHCGQCLLACPNGAHVMADSRHQLYHAKCSACGLCVAACPERALTLAGHSMTLQEIMGEVVKDIVFYQTSGGGMTIGGGEPLCQPDAVAGLLMACRQTGIHTAIETCGHVAAANVEKAAGLADLFLFDIKHMDPARHKALTGVDNRTILANLAWLLDNGFPVRVRMPLVGGCNADLEEMRRRLDFLSQWRGHANFMGVDLLPYHKFGTHKYANLGENYKLGPDADVTPGFLEAAQNLFASANIPVAIIRH